VDMFGAAYRQYCRLRKRHLKPWSAGQYAVGGNADAACRSSADFVSPLFDARQRQKALGHFAVQQHRLPSRSKEAAITVTQADAGTRPAHGTAAALDCSAAEKQKTRLMAWQRRNASTFQLITNLRSGLAARPTPITAICMSLNEVDLEIPPCRARSGWNKQIGRQGHAVAAPDYYIADGDSHRTPCQRFARGMEGGGWSRTDFARSSVPWTDILSGGPPKDGIPAIDQPKFEIVSSVKDLVPNEPVIGLDIAGDARAYPLRVLIWHEIVNDTVGGKPVTVTYCPLCNAALVFERNVEGRLFDFGTTGKLRHSDLVMYDRQTESWWQQFTGEAIIGEMLGTVLPLVPARLESFADFKARHPEGKVLVPGDPGLP
jgi:hypothetical protein